MLKKASLFLFLVSLSGLSFSMETPADKWKRLSINPDNKTNSQLMDEREQVKLARLRARVARFGLKVYVEERDYALEAQEYKSPRRSSN